MPDLSFERAGLGQLQPVGADRCAAAHLTDSSPRRE